MTAPAPCPVRHAVVPAAGRGTRMRALRGSLPKELLPIGGVPMIFYALADLISSGIDRIAIVSAPDKPAIEEALLAPDKGTAEPEELVALRRRLADCDLRFVVQPEPRGVADAIACARPHLGSDPFVLHLPDNIFLGTPPATGQLLETFARVGQPTVGLVRMTPGTVAGVDSCAAIESESVGDACVRITRVRDKAAGSLTGAARGGWRRGAVSILTHAFLDVNAHLPPNANGEWDDVPVFQRLAATGRLFGRKLRNTCYDVGNPTGHAAAEAAGVRLPTAPATSHV